MRMKFSVFTFLALFFSSTFAVAQTDAEKDSLAVLQAFEKLKTNRAFLKELALIKEKHYQFSDFILKPILGDLNHDETVDALLVFSIENRGGGNNYDIHYAVFMQENKKWNYVSLFDAGTDKSEYFIGFQSIESGIIRGVKLQEDDESTGKPVAYILKDKEIIETSLP